MGKRGSRWLAAISTPGCEVRTQRNARTSPVGVRVKAGGFFGAVCGSLLPWQGNRREKLPDFEVFHGTNVYLRHSDASKVSNFEPGQRYRIGENDFSTFSLPRSPTSVSGSFRRKVDLYRGKNVIYTVIYPRRILVYI